MRKAIGAIGAAFLLASCASLMQGAIEISYQIDSGTPTVCGSAGCSAVSAPPVTIQQISAISNSPGTSSLAEQFEATQHISTTADTTVHIWISAQGFTAPTTPPAIKYSSTLSITSISGTGTVNLESCVDGSNGLTPPIDTFCSVPEATLFNTDTETILSLTTTPYSLEQELTVSLDAGSEINILSSQVLTPVPEPATFALLGTGILGAGLLFRRKLGRANRSF